MKLSKTNIVAEFAMTIRISVLVFTSLCTVILSAQNNALILNNAVVININGGAVLSINQSSPSGISVIGTGTGYIQSENETNRVAWNINNGTGSYTIPFGVASTGSKIDMVYNVTGAGSSSGTLVASTYATAVDNTSYPAVYSPAVTNMELEGSGTGDKSLFAVDRFWVLRKANWTTEPVSFLTFTYRDVEFAPANTITETSLLAQYWDGAQWTPAWNSGTALFGVNNAGANQVNSISTGSGNFYTWILADKSSFLPVELLSFESDCDASGKPILSWVSASETNNDYYSLERSSDGISWMHVADIPGAGNSNSPLFYTYVDNGASDEISYYRLSQTDFDGTSETAGVVTSLCHQEQTSESGSFWVSCQNNHEISLNFFSSSEDPVAVRVIDLRGRLVYSGILNAIKGTNSFVIPVMPEDAVYMLTLTGAGVNLSKKIFIQ